jgi:ATP-dependent NAD(P)H-hydrate dehydratase
VVEFGRLWKGLKVQDSEAKSETAQVEALSKALGGVTIVQKGGNDYISDGEQTLVVDLEGGLKRSGGQGDTLTGSIATFLAWRKAYLDGLWDHGGKLDEGEMLGLAAFGGAAITRVSFSLPLAVFSVALNVDNRILCSQITGKLATCIQEEGSELAG